MSPRPGFVLEVEESTFESSPETLSHSARELLRGVHKLSGQLLLVLDTDKAVCVAP